MHFLPDFVHPSWNEFIEEDIVKEELSFIYQAIKDEPYAPCEKETLRFLSRDLSSIRYVVVGMDPYPSEINGVPEATGRSFEVRSLDDWTKPFKQASLRNILKSLYYNQTGVNAPFSFIRENILDGDFRILPPHEWFEYTEKQGFLWLNSTLTVRIGEPNSHTMLWTKFMDILVEYIDCFAHPDVVWFLFGNNAQNRIKPLVLPNYQILAMHPRLPGFVLENPFGKVNGVDFYG